MVGVLQDEGHNPYPVAATGFLLGSQVTLVLYGLHVCQISRYYSRFGRTDKKKYRWVLVPTVFGLSSIHIGMIVFSAHHYLIQGILHPTIWDTFYGGLSGQDFIIPMMSFVSHIFFGHRIYILRNIKVYWWWAFVTFASITCAIGVIFAALARAWSMHPFQDEQSFKAMKIGPVADSFPTAWLTCAAAIDGGLTVGLLLSLLKERRTSSNTRRILYEVAALTLETVLITHIIGATLFVLWLTTRTRTNAFWFLIEIIAETYALSILFTLNSRNRFRKTARPNSQQMIDRQLEHINGTAELADLNYPPSMPMPLSAGASSKRPINRVRWSDVSDSAASDMEKGKIAAITATASTVETKEKGRSESGSSASSSNATPEQAFLPTLVDLPAHPKPASSTGHRRVSSLPAIFR